MSIFNPQIACTGFNFHHAVNDAHSRTLAGAGGNWPASRKRHVSQPFRRWTTHFAFLFLPLIFLGGAAFHASAQIIETVAGGGIGDGGRATSTTITSRRIAVDALGNLYIPDAFNNNNYRIRKVAAGTGIITTVAGTGSPGYNGDSVAATTAMLDMPLAVAIDSAGNFYIADSQNYRIRKVTAATGTITTVAGTGTSGYNSDNIAAISATLDQPIALAIDAFSNLYIICNSRIRKVTAATGIITTVAGTGTSGYNGDNIAASSAMLNAPTGVVVDARGDLYIADRKNYRIRKVSTATGIISTIAGTGVLGFNGENVAATSATLYYPVDVAVDAEGSVYIADESSRIRKVAAATGIITTVAGTGIHGYNGDSFAATSAMLQVPSGVTVDSAGNLYIADQGNKRIRKVAAVGGIITTVAGNGTMTFGGDGGGAASAILYTPTGAAVAPNGDLYIAEPFNSRIRKVSSATGLMTTVAGTGPTIGLNSYNGDNIFAIEATLIPGAVAVDSLHNLYIADSYNSRIRKVTAATGVITTVAGTGAAGYNGDNIAATGALLNGPTGVAIDASGNLYISEKNNHRVRKLTATTGVITTVAGTGTAGYNGDNIGATAAMLDSPGGLAVDVSGNLFIADTVNARTRKVSSATGLITTVIGVGPSAISLGDGILATSATLGISYSVAVDGAGNLYVTDGSRVRKVTAETGMITTVAGTGLRGYNGDGIPAATATLNRPSGIAVDTTGNLFIVDTVNNRIRKVSAAAAANYQGLWWNAPGDSESGWGINLAHQGNDIFATWFTYDATGKALWLSMTANKIGTNYIGTLYQTGGPVFSAMPFNPALVTRTAVGSGTLTFSDTNNARFAYIFNGATQTKSITRQVFGPLPSCTFGVQPNLALAINYQDIWWAAPGGIESGWGVNFTHQGDTIFATWFTYDADGTPLWLSATATKSRANIYTGMLYRTTGPAFNAVPFLAASVGRTAVGTLMLTFANGNDATFAYTAYGVVQSKPITRQVFNTPGTMCQ